MYDFENWWGEEVPRTKRTKRGMNKQVAIATQELYGESFSLKQAMEHAYRSGWGACHLSNTTEVEK